MPEHTMEASSPVIPGDQTGNAQGLRVLIVSPVRVVAAALAAAISEQPWVTSADTAWSGWPDAAGARDAPPDVVVLDVRGKQPLDLSVRAAGVDAPVVVVGVASDESDLLGCIEAGASGYVLDDEPMDRLFDVVRAAARGEADCSPKVTAALMRRLATRPAPRRHDHEVLTRREREVLEFIERGLANKEIAVELSIDVRTVKSHVHHVLRKLNVTRRGEAAAMARGMGVRALP